MIRIGIVGIAGYGWHHVEAIRQCAESLHCRLIAVADDHMDGQPDRRDQLRRDGVELFDDALAMYDAVAGRCEAMIVATGIGSHERLVVEAFKRGFHVYVEKPPAATVQAVDAMHAAARAAGKMGMVGFQAVHGEDIRFVKGRIVEGRLGSVKTITCRAGWPRTAAYYDRTAWAGALKSHSTWVLDGPATNALCHQLNNMLFFASPVAGGYAAPAAVRAELYHAGQITGHDTAAIEIETAEGPVLRFLGTHCTRELFGPVIEIEGDKGRCTWGITGETTLTYASGRQEGRPASREQARLQVTMDFLRAIETGDASLLGCDLPAGRQTVLALDGAHESSGRIHAIAPEHSRQLDPGTPEARVVVEGMDELVLAAAERRCLFSDLPDSPAWAVATERFDLTGYRKFPVRFSDAAEA